MTKIVLRLPIPPSTNALFANRLKKRKGARGRIITEAYEAWREEAGYRANTQIGLTAGFRCIDGPSRFLIEMKQPTKSSDIDNRIKAVLDLCVRHRVIGEDRNVVDLRVRWADVPECRVMVEAA